MSDIDKAKAIRAKHLKIMEGATISPAVQTVINRLSGRDGSNVVQLSVYQKKRGRKVTLSVRRQPKGNWLSYGRKAFKHCLIAMRKLFGQ